MDGFAIYEAAVDAVGRARRGEGPTLIEAKTYRIGDHAEGEAAFLAGQDYRPPEERQAARDKDPLPSMRRTLVELGFAGEADLDMIETQIATAMANSIDFARQSPVPGAEVIYQDMWA